MTKLWVVASFHLDKDDFVVSPIKHDQVKFIIFKDHILIDNQIVFVNQQFFSASFSERASDKMRPLILLG